MDQVVVVKIQSITNPKIKSDKIVAKPRPKYHTELEG